MAGSKANIFCGERKNRDRERAEQRHSLKIALKEHHNQGREKNVLPFLEREED